MKALDVVVSRSPRIAALATLALTAMAVSAHAAPVTVVNGGFEQTLTPNSSQFGAQFAQQQVTGWTTSGYNFVFLPGTADTTGAVGQFNGLSNPVKLWGPGDGSNNGLTASPNGGNYLALNGVFEVGPVSQMLTGLTAGVATTVSFDWAGAQQYGYNGATTEQLLVSLGSQTLATAILDDPSHGFTGWKTASLTFTPTDSTEMLSFLAKGTPGGEPPNVLLDGVSVSQNSPVPEPSTLALLGTGLAGVSGMLRRRYKR